MPEQDKEKRFRIVIGGYQVTCWNPKSGKEETFDSQGPKEIGNARIEQVLGVQKVLLGGASALMKITEEHAEKKAGK